MVGNVPAVNMEEVVPLATSQSTLLAPEEIKVSSVCVHVCVVCSVCVSFHSSDLHLHMYMCSLAE